MYFYTALALLLWNHHPMFIRSTTIKTDQAGKTYQSFRLVETERVNGKVKQRKLINLGCFFDAPKAQWQSLSSRIDQWLTGQNALPRIDLDTDLEEMLVRPSRIGIEHLALHAVKQLTLDDKLKALGFNQHHVAAALGNIIGRMAAPASELATHGWLQATSGLGELIDYDFEGMSLDLLYQVSDQLWKHKEAIEAHLYQQERDLFVSTRPSHYTIWPTLFLKVKPNKPASPTGLL
jgi:hypothetical protein